MNEEEIRGKLLLPYLHDLGFDPSEISLEESFSIKFGKSKRTINGRSDILCKRNGKNLFIIELKNDSISISQEDIDQGISYARLLTDNIAPFTIVTNGKITKIFDSISRDELTGTNIAKQSSYWQNDCTLSMDTDLQIRYEALKKFVSFSSVNLKRFCEDQVQDRMGTIIGDIDKPYAKFVQKLYVQRQGLENTFDDFIRSKASIFGIVGAAGVGKTSAMCSLVLKKLETEFVFFYNAAIINKSPLEHIAQDLNGFFSSRSESDVVLKKLDELGRFLNKTILIFIDAIDESTDSNLSIELSEMALAVRNLEKVKLCVSCKSNIWSALLKRNDTPTYLFEELRKSHPIISSVENCPGLLLDNFSDEEIHRIIPLYREVFGFKGQISTSVFEALRNGFFLRIFSEVYSHRNIPEKINDRQLIRRYIQLSLEKTSLDYQYGLRILSKIGKVLLDHTYSSQDAYHDDGISVEHLMEKLAFSLSETIPEDLFTRNLLIKSNKHDSYNVSFYYSKIRDYIICFHSFQLDKLSDQAFYDLLDKFYENHIGQSAISFYVDNASSSHQRTMISFKKDKALQYVNSYTIYLEKHFNNFKSKFDPYTDGAIGIYLPEDVLHKNGYALFRLPSHSQPKVQFEQIGDLFSSGYDYLFEKGVDTIHSSNHALLSPNQDKTIRKNIFEQLKKLIEKGSLSVYNSDSLLLEQVSAILYYYSKELQQNSKFDDYYLPRFNLIFPIDLQDVKKRAYQFRVREYYRREYHLNPKERSELIGNALNGHIDIPRLNIMGDFPPIEELEKIVDILLKRGYTEIKEHFLPCPDISIQEVKAISEGERRLEMSQIRTVQFSEKQGKLYIESFLKHFDDSYRAFVEFCFPTFKEQFPFYMTGPHEYFVYMKDTVVLKWGMLGYRQSISQEVNVHFRKMRSPDEPFPSEETDILHAFSLDHIIHNDDYPLLKTIDRINTPKVDEFCVLRNWVYKFIKRDMQKLFKENGE
ncbi:NTPase (NACHT family) [Niastella caeni]|uniref:NTPase (NACHT family) n=1 Tax=Niastella caeni TaxID=2569763 RepID=A0A4S8I315_9BACT|nr:type I restriction enzyme HsdR N-terminal domain-containing protein [Niastella caeni]THU40382.1 NTPase (NACHT family) [Niastella caeni]